MKQELPEVQLYGIGPDEADHAAPLLTAEAVTYIKNDEAFGMALVEEGEARAAVCAGFMAEFILKVHRWVRYFCRCFNNTNKICLKR